MYFIDYSVEYLSSIASFIISTSQFHWPLSKLFTTEPTSRKLESGDDGGSWRRENRLATSSNFSRPMRISVVVNVSNKTVICVIEKLDETRLPETKRQNEWRWPCSSANLVIFVRTRAISLCSGDTSSSDYSSWQLRTVNHSRFLSNRDFWPQFASVFRPLSTSCTRFVLRYSAKVWIFFNLDRRLNVSY